MNAALRYQNPRPKPRPPVARRFTTLQAIGVAMLDVSASLINMFMGGGPAALAARRARWHPLLHAECNNQRRANPKAWQSAWQEPWPAVLEVRQCKPC